MHALIDLFFRYLSLNFILFFHIKEFSFLQWKVTVTWIWQEKTIFQIEIWAENSNKRKTIKDLKIINKRFMGHGTNKTADLLSVRLRLANI